MRWQQIYFFIGTTAEFIKLLPVIKELKTRKIQYKIIASKQNSINLREFNSVLGKQRIHGKLGTKLVNLPLPSPVIFALWTLVSLFYSYIFFKKEFKNIDRKNIAFIVHGDTVTSLLGSITARIFKVQLIHIESGLRSYNFSEPFPEELCRFITSKLAEINFCPNSWAVKNLINSRGVKINTKNNTLLESLFLISKNRKVKTKIALPEKFFLLILHRQEHIFFKKNLIKKYLKIFTEYANQDLKCVFILHKLTEDFLKKEGLLDKLKGNKNILLMSRMPYGEFMQVMSKAEFIATDGGSNQEETYYLGKPCLILRNVTERIEGLGKNAILSKGNDEIIRNFIKNYKDYKRAFVRISVTPSKIIADYLLK